MAYRLQQSAWCVAGVAALTALSLVRAAAQSPQPDRARGSAIERVSRYVEQYYGRAQSLIVEETVIVQPVRRDLVPDGFARHLVYELRFEWTPGTSGEKARIEVVRQLVRANNRTPKRGAEPKCLDPLPVTPEPLAFLLPTHRDEFEFLNAGAARVDGRAAVLLDYKSLVAGKPTARPDPYGTGDMDCVFLDVPGRNRGRIWVDADTDAVLRMDEGLIGPTDVPVPRDLQVRRRYPMYITVDRSDTTVRYGPVTFADPEETLMLPTRIESVWVTMGLGIQGTRMVQEYRNYRRFLTASRILQ